MGQPCEAYEAEGLRGSEVWQRFVGFWWLNVPDRGWRRVYRLEWALEREGGDMGGLGSNTPHSFPRYWALRAIHAV